MTPSTSLPRPAEYDPAIERAVMSWHGWGSPVGLGIGLLAIGATAVLVRFAVFGAF
ncbi:MAG TPA: hypothetical protein VKY24_06845 [Reyranella sp.]|jgi:hypothetical protein|nr:hypothetical protein [Reyranella sp.]